MYDLKCLIVSFLTVNKIIEKSFKVECLYYIQCIENCISNHEETKTLIFCGSLGMLIKFSTSKVPQQFKIIHNDMYVSSLGRAQLLLIIIIAILEFLLWKVNRDFY